MEGGGVRLVRLLEFPICLSQPDPNPRVRRLKLGSCFQLRLSDWEIILVKSNEARSERCFEGIRAEE
jgi:hypothetical protein